MKVIAVDDERNALEAIHQDLCMIPEITDIQLFNDPENALCYVKQHPVDVAFLDIEMYGINGLTLAKQLKEICSNTNIIFVTGYSEYAVDAFGLAASGYLLKPTTQAAIQKALNQLRHPIISEPVSHIHVQTFGNFEIFADNKPIAFGRAKSKELLAYLIDRGGARINKRELAAILFEDDSYNRSKQSYLQTLVAELMKSLKAIGAEKIIIKDYNGLAVDKTKLDCDYYRFLSGDMSAVNSYTGEYMKQYSWAEFTLATLEQKNLKA